MLEIERKSKLRNWKYNVIYIQSREGWGEFPIWNEAKPITNPFGIPTRKEKKTTDLMEGHPRRAKTKGKGGQIVATTG